jgi:Trk K+ transport system NAD-binding subunit
LPYEAQAQDWPERDRDRFFEIIERCNEERMTSFRYDDMTVSKNTEAMFDLADVVIAVWNGKPGEIDYALLRAEKRGIPTVIVRVDEYYN